MACGVVSEPLIPILTLGYSLSAIVLGTFSPPHQTSTHQIGSRPPGARLDAYETWNYAVLLVVLTIAPPLPPATHG